MTALIRTVLFLALLVAPWLVSLAGLVTPNRDDVDGPPRVRFDLAGLAALAADPAALGPALTDYFDVAFPCRDALIREKNRLAPALIGESAQPGVVLGRDGWLFYNLERALDDYVNVMDLSVALQDRMVAILAARRDWLAARGVAFYVLVPPDKHGAYPEYLPRGLSPIGPASRLRIMKKRLAEAGVTVIDAREELDAAKAERRTYQKTDTHWNDWGAFVAARALVAAMRRDFPAMPPLSEDDWEVVESVTKGGDLAEMLLLEDRLTEHDIRLAPRFKAKARPGAPRPYADPANHPERAMVVTATGQKDWPKLLMFRDSFATAMIPFLAERTREAVFIWNHAFFPDIVAAEKPDAVVLEVVERYLYAFSLENPTSMNAGTSGTGTEPAGEDGKEETRP